MKVEEFSNEFDTLLNSYSTINQFGKVNDIPSIELDEYEKSIFLTKAQEEIVIEYYTGRTSYREGFERTEEIRRYLNDLVKTNIITEKLVDHIGLSDKSVFFQLPEDVWFITYESVILNDNSLGCLDGNNAIVVPVTQDEYNRISKNPFRKPSENRVLRLDTNDKVVEIISDYNIKSYLVRYLAKPTPIILIDLQDLSINGIKVKTECKLNPVIHRAILERAVKLAIISKTQMSGNK